jgi:hypothetical protein
VLWCQRNKIPPSFLYQSLNTVYYCYYSYLLYQSLNTVYYCYYSYLGLSQYPQLLTYISSYLASVRKKWHSSLKRSLEAKFSFSTHACFIAVAQHPVNKHLLLYCQKHLVQSQYVLFSTLRL